MKKMLAAVLALVLLAGCVGPAQPASPSEEQTLHVLCTTYPVYLFTTAVTKGADGVEVSLLVNSQTSCLHDYTLTVNDMKAIERADVIILNGAGLEEFMEDALAHSQSQIIDCSAGIELLEGPDEHHGHEESDPHIWMDTLRANHMVANIQVGLSALDNGHAETYRSNTKQAQEELLAFDKEHSYTGPMLAHNQLITFHDGFQYFAQAFDLTLLKAIEEEEGATASAAEMQEIVELIQEHHIPAIFTERNGSAATARAIAAETGCGVYELDMIMSGDGVGLQPYLDAMNRNLATIEEALGG